MIPIYLVGARLDGQAGVVLDAICKEKKHNVVGFIDNTPTLKNKDVAGITVVGSSDDIESLELITNCFHVSIGDNIGRGRVTDRIQQCGYSLISVIHPSAIIGENVKIGTGCYIGPGSIINYNSVIENGVIINSGAIVEHDNIIKKYAHIGPGVKTAGRVTVGEYSFIGIGATIIPDIAIGKYVMVGAGSTVIKNVMDKNTVYGFAAKLKEGDLGNIYKDVIPDV